MGRLINLMRCTVTLTAAGRYPERLLNLCAQERIPCWGLVWVDSHTLQLTIHRQRLALVEELAGRAGCEITVEGSRGLPHFLLRFRRRYAFLIGLALSLLAVCILSRFVLTIQVTGNETVSTAEILGELNRLGVSPGVYGPSLDRKVIAQQALLELDELSWMSINLYGTRLEVVVREVVEPPQLVQEEGYFDIVARTDGIVTQIEPLQGEAVVAEGDTVAKGDVLISGIITMEPPIYTDFPTRYYQTQARGRVYARTWRTLTAAIPTQAQIKAYTGEEHTAIGLSLLGHRLDFFQSSSFFSTGYDKITEVHPLTLPGGRVLPMMLTVTHCRAYETETVSIQLSSAQTMLEEQLLAQLHSLIGEDGQIVDLQYSARVSQGRLDVTLTAECREEIGQQVPGSGEIPGDAPGEENEHE